MPSEADKKWQDEADVALTKGEELAKRASDDAVKYLADVMENLGDKAWRKMAVERHAIEIGTGVAFADVIVAKIYNTMRKHMNKKGKFSKQDADMLARIFIGRVVQNIVKELNHEANKEG